MATSRFRDNILWFHWQLGENERIIEKSVRSMSEPQHKIYRKNIQATPFGPVVIFWRPAAHVSRIVRVLLSRPGLSAESASSGLFPGASLSSCPELDREADAVAAFLEGEDVTFSLEWVDLDSCSPFQRNVLRAEHKIPRGMLSTYQLIARRLGKPGGARAVGSALANNPFPIIVPCHRAVRSDGFPGGYQGGAAMKRSLLEKEGIAFDIKGRVIAPRFYFG